MPLNTTSKAKIAFRRNGVEQTNRSFSLSQLNSADIAIYFTFNDSTYYNYSVHTSRICTANPQTNHHYTPPVSGVGTGSQFLNSLGASIAFSSIDDGTISSGCTYSILLNWWKVNSSSLTTIRNVYNYRGGVSNIYYGSDAGIDIIEVNVTP